MQLAPGMRLAHYEISSLLGRGGMGEVWRATDTKLGREVAIKVLPDEFTKDAERLARFEREARLLAALDHTNVASIHGIDDEGGSKFLVMQLAAGEDLSDRLLRGAIPPDEALQIARQITEALEAAHEQGIVHRDLKPANIKLDDEGNVKVLDFGLAKAMESEDSVEDFSNSPTMVRAATNAGVILGTAGYMSPEQARGKKVDKRADIWAFGVVLWEMLTGRRLFGGETVSDTLAAVLRAEVDLTTLPDNVPPGIRTLLRRCLDRNPRNRLHDIADARLIIDDVLSNAPDVSGGIERAAPPRPGRILAWVAALVAVGLLAAYLGQRSARRSVSTPEPQRFAIYLEPNQEIRPEVFAFSPDGRTLVFQGIENGRDVLLRRRIGEREASPIPGTDFGDYAFFSPDGQWLGFGRQGTMHKVPIDGGRPQALAEVRGPGGAAWLRDDTIVFAPMYSDGLFRISSGGGTSTRLTTPDRESGELGHWWPDPLPSEKKIVFTAFRTPVNQSRIGVVDLETNEVKWVVDGGFFARWVPTGHLLYARDNRVFAVPFDPEAVEVTGRAVEVVDDVHVSDTNGSAAYAVSSLGTLAYVRVATGDPMRELVWLDREGRATPATPEHRRFRSVSLSPDGRHAALTIQEQSLDIWTYTFDRGTMSRLTSSEKSEYDAAWSADGKELFYVVDSPPFELFRIPVGAPDTGRPIFEEKTNLDTFSVLAAPGGDLVGFVVSEVETGTNIYVRRLDGSEGRAFRATRSEERGLTFSPDGMWIAYTSDETGRSEVYVEPFPGPGDRMQATSDGGFSPQWAANGELFFRRDDEVWVIPTRRGDRLELDEPKKLFSFPIAPGVNESLLTYAVTADGHRFLVAKVPDALRSRQIEIVTNWTSGLKGKEIREKR